MFTSTHFIAVLLHSYFRVIFFNQHFVSSVSAADNLPVSLVVVVAPSVGGGQQSRPLVVA
jgi:hypothetical protein